MVNIAVCGITVQYIHQLGVDSLCTLLRYIKPTIIMLINNIAR